MSAWHLAQLVLGAVVLGLVLRGLRVLTATGSGDDEALIDAVEVALRAQQPALARAIAQACTPAWSAHALLAALDSADRAQAVAAMDDSLSLHVGAQLDRIKTIAALGRIASPLGFLAILFEIAAAFRPGHGLLELQRGLVQAIALERGLLSLGIGVGTTLVAATSATLLRGRLLQLTRSVRRGRDRIQAQLPAPAHM